MPLGEYILRRRLSLAAIILKMTSIPVTDVAYLLHYHSGQGFSRAFKKMLGLTPTEYRSAKEWDFDILQPSFLLEDFKIPDIKICELNESFTYDNEILEHDHLFDTSVYDITKKIKQLLIEKHPNIQTFTNSPFCRAGQNCWGKADPIWWRFSFPIQETATKRKTYNVYLLQEHMQKCDLKVPGKVTVPITKLPLSGQWLSIA